MTDVEPSSIPEATPSGDPEAFCACGHDIGYHDTARCRAVEPEPTCTCRGFRYGTRSRHDRRNHAAS